LRRCSSVDAATHLWELSVNREHHAEMAARPEVVAALVKCMGQDGG
jgi:hypothetical protein